MKVVIRNRGKKYFLIVSIIEKLSKYKYNSFSKQKLYFLRLKVKYLKIA